MINAEAVKNAIDRHAECAEHLDPEGAFVLGASVILEMHLIASYEIMEHGPSRDAVRSEIDRVSSIIMNLVAESLVDTGCVYDPMQRGRGRKRPSARRVPVRPVRVDERPAEGDQPRTTRQIAADTPDS